MTMILRKICIHINYRLYYVGYYIKTIKTKSNYLEVCRKILLSISKKIIVRNMRFMYCFSKT